MLVKADTELSHICQTFHVAQGLSDMSEILHGIIVQEKIKAADVGAGDFDYGKTILFEY